MLHLNETQREAVESALFGGRKIEAIKLIRGYTGAGLAEAKRFADQYEGELRSADPDRFVTNRHGPLAHRRARVRAVDRRGGGGGAGAGGAEAVVTRPSPAGAHAAWGVPRP